MSAADKDAAIDAAFEAANAAHNHAEGLELELWGDLEQAAAAGTPLDPGPLFERYKAVIEALELAQSAGFEHDELLTQVRIQEAAQGARAVRCSPEELRAHLQRVIERQAELPELIRALSCATATMCPDARPVLGCLELIAAAPAANFSFAVAVCQAVIDALPVLRTRERHQVGL